MDEGKKRVVVIPVFNEERSIASVVAGIPREFAIVAVDDGSADGTRGVLKKISLEGRNFVVLPSEKNQGVGAALKKGFAYALQNGFEEIFCLDGDGQHPPNKLLELSGELKNADAIFASRFLDGRQAAAIPFWRRHGNRLFTGAANFLFGSKYSDALCGMRGFRRGALQKLLPQMREDGYGSVLETALLAAKKNLVVKEIPIEGIYSAERRHNYSLPKLFFALLATLIKTFFPK